jgi:hypothetical protein
MAIADGGQFFSLTVFWESGNIEGGEWGRSSPTTEVCIIENLTLKAASGGAQAQKRTFVLYKI